MKVSDVFSSAQIEYLNRSYHPLTVENQFLTWVADGKIYLGNWIDLSVESQESIDSLLKLFILYKAHQLPQFLQYSEDLRINLNENLKQVVKRQQRDKNQTRGKVVYNSSPENFGDDFGWN